jgi:hypothetical protein
MMHVREFKLIFDLVIFINKNYIKKEEIVKIGTKNNSLGDKVIPDLYFVVFHSEKESFEEVPIKLTV